MRLLLWFSLFKISQENPFGGGARRSPAAVRRGAVVFISADAAIEQPVPDGCIALQGRTHSARPSRQSACHLGITRNRSFLKRFLPFLSYPRAFVSAQR
jgi:hypothetical protein